MRALLAMTLAVVLVPAAARAEEEKKGGPPFGERPKSADKPKPAERSWTVGQEGKFVFAFNFKPGIPSPDEVTEILFTANAIPKTPHPRFGSRVPLENADLVVEVTSPGGELIGRFRAHSIPGSAGKYGLHFTPAQDGIYVLALKGTTEDGAALTAQVKLPVNVWPLPADLEGTGEDKGSATGRKPVKG